MLRDLCGQFGECLMSSGLTFQRTQALATKSHKGGDLCIQEKGVKSRSFSKYFWSVSIDIYDFRYDCFDVGMCHKESHGA